MSNSNDKKLNGKPICIGTTRGGNPCTHRAKSGSDYCRRHQKQSPEARAKKAGKENQGTEAQPDEDIINVPASIICSGPCSTKKKYGERGEENNDEEISSEDALSFREDGLQLAMSRLKGEPKKAAAAKGALRRLRTNEPFGYCRECAKKLSRHFKVGLRELFTPFTQFYCEWEKARIAAEEKKREEEEAIDRALREKEAREAEALAAEEAELESFGFDDDSDEDSDSDVKALIRLWIRELLAGKLSTGELCFQNVSDLRKNQPVPCQNPHHEPLVIGTMLDECFSSSGKLINRMRAMWVKAEEIKSVGGVSRRVGTQQRLVYLCSDCGAMVTEESEGRISPPAIVQLFKKQHGIGQKPKPPQHREDRNSEHSPRDHLFVVPCKNHTELTAVATTKIGEYTDPWKALCDSALCRDCANKADRAGEETFAIGETIKGLGYSKRVLGFKLLNEGGFVCRQCSEPACYNERIEKSFADTTDDDIRGASLCNSCADKVSRDCGSNCADDNDDMFPIIHTLARVHISRLHHDQGQSNSQAPRQDFGEESAQAVDEVLGKASPRGKVFQNRPFAVLKDAGRNSD
jgi:hypothetical protein